MKAAEVMITNVITVVEKVLAQLQAEAWTKPSLINVIVQDGTVELRSSGASGVLTRTILISVKDPRLRTSYSLTVYPS